MMKMKMKIEDWIMVVTRIKMVWLEGGWTRLDLPLSIQSMLGVEPCG